MDERQTSKGIDGGTTHAGPGAAGGLDADRIDFSLGAVGMARGRDIRIGQAAVGLAAGDEIELRQSSVRLALARESVRLDTAAAATVIGNRVEVGPRTAVAVLVAGHVEGDVRPLLDWRGAAVLGGVLALVGAVVGLRSPSTGGRRRGRSRSG